MSTFRSEIFSLPLELWNACRRVFALEKYKSVRDVYHNPKLYERVQGVYSTEGGCQRDVALTARRTYALLKQPPSAPAKAAPNGVNCADIVS